jgi:hypothetical protein
MAVAWFSYRLYYPPLTHEQAHKPYAPRIPEDEYTDSFDDREGSETGVEGTIKRPAGGVGQGAIGAGVRNSGSEGSGSSRDGYRDVELGQTRRL